MNVKQAYDAWSKDYDTVENKTRDLEARAIREMVAPDEPCAILEIACGTGKNTEYLKSKATRFVAVDFSDEMLEQARRKNRDVSFRRLDLREKWMFEDDAFDFVTCSLALEHIENIAFVFSEAARVLKSGGRFYFGELHPFKQYQGSKARFETAGGTFELECFVHHVEEFFNAANTSGFHVESIREWFDDDDRTNIPRLLTMIVAKP